MGEGCYSTAPKRNLRIKMARWVDIFAEDRRGKNKKEKRQRNNNQTNKLTNQDRQADTNSVNDTAHKRKKIQR